MQKSKVTVGIMVVTLTIGLFAGLHLNSSASGAETSGGSTLFWLTLAQNAWCYFQPGIGVDSVTGLAQSSIGSLSFTDWDLGLYVEATINAYKLGLINDEGTWGLNDRVNRVLTFLENRPLTPYGLPYLVYSAQTGQIIDDTPQVATDAGKLFVALKNLETFKPQFQSRIDKIVYNHTDYERRRISVDILLGQMQDGTRGANIYDYYVTLGFAGFWPERYLGEAAGILDFSMSAPTINYSGVMLPKIKLSCDPLLYCIFDFPNIDARILNLTRQVYLAHEMYYNLTGKFRAFGEANTGLTNPAYVYEWTVMPDGRMWIIQVVEPNDTNNLEVHLSPIVCLKAAVGLLAIYNNAFTQNMVSYLLHRLPAPVTGYNDGLDEEGRTVEASLGIGNSLIISAAKYAIANNVTVPLSATTSANLPSASPVSKPTSDSQKTPVPSPFNANPTQQVSPNISTSTDPQINPYPMSKQSHPNIVLLIMIPVIPFVLFALYRALNKKRTRA